QAVGLGLAVYLYKHFKLLDFYLLVSQSPALLIHKPSLIMLSLVWRLKSIALGFPWKKWALLLKKALIPGSYIHEKIKSQVFMFSGMVLAYNNEKKEEKEVGKKLKHFGRGLLALIIFIK
ncbi:MAG: hypothetical protein JRI34_09145, partial [Deltaproteobacteria bacterium]|nr:hypothetical protein [Deltaproteobacteria bacterium]